LIVRQASRDDLAAICSIYNQGIEDRIATLDAELKSSGEIADWYDAHGGRYAVLVAQEGGAIVGWASLNRYSHRCAYDGVADLSIYVARGWRNRGVGALLLAELEAAAVRNDFHKIVLFTLSFNALGRSLYRRRGFSEVGVFREQGKVDGRYVDVLAMEKLLPGEEGQSVV
jgi:phosphinothricin acetyltransferase